MINNLLYALQSVSRCLTHLKMRFYHNWCVTYASSRAYSASSLAVNTSNTTCRTEVPGFSSNQLRTERTAMPQAWSAGKPNTPVLMQQKVMLLSPRCDAAFKHAR